MTATEREELDALAGEFVLGTLSPEERAAAEARLRSDSAFRAAVAAWETRLQPLADAAPVAEPRSGLLDSILARIDAGGASAVKSEATNVVPAHVLALRRSLRRWKMTATIAGAAAAALAGFVILDLARPPPDDEFVAVLTSEGAAPAFVATVNVADRTLSIRRIGTPPPPDKSHELWAVAPGAAPRSLGLVQEASLSRDLDLPPGDLTLAVSLEPVGGSITGAPTGPVLFSGVLVSAK